MSAVYELFAAFLDHALRPLPAWALAFLPLVIAIAGVASLNARSDDRVLASVQAISGVALCIWLLLPWHPPEPEVIAMNRSVTLFAYGYVLQDWLREAWRSGLYPRWAHGLVLFWLLMCGVALIVAPIPDPISPPISTPISTPILAPASLPAAD